MTELQDCYSTINDPYGNPREEGRPHQGTDYNRSAGQTILAYDDMTVKHVIDQNKYFGTAIGCQRMTIGGFAGWTHVRNPVQRDTFVHKGGVLGYVAGEGPDAGEDWDGAHTHTTQSSVSSSDTARGSGNGFSDPAPVIAEAIKTLTIPTPQGIRKKCVSSNYPEVTSTYLATPVGKPTSETWMTLTCLDNTCPVIPDNSTRQNLTLSMNT